MIGDVHVQDQEIISDAQDLDLKIERDQDLLIDITKIIPAAVVAEQIIIVVIRVGVTIVEMMGAVMDIVDLATPPPPVAMLTLPAHVQGQAVLMLQHRNLVDMASVTILVTRMALTPWLDSIYEGLNGKACS